MRGFTGFRTGLLIVFAGALTACGPHYILPPDARFATDFNKNEPLAALTMPSGGASHSIMLKTLGVSTMQKNAIVGGNGVGPDCKLAGTIRVNSADTPIPPPIAWRRAFYRVLTEANYNVMGNPDDDFENKTELRPDYLLSVKITDEKRNDCYPSNAAGANLPHTSEAGVDVLWEVYNVAQSRVVLTVPTSGYAKGGLSSDPLQNEVVNKIIENNVKALAANQEFHDLLLSTSKTHANAGASPHVNITMGRQLTGSISDNIAKIQGSVVTIRFAGGFGSGVAITPDGYILTDRHVVGNATIVRVITENEQELDADVVASDARYDIALLKARHSIGNNLPMAKLAPAVGAEVFAVGTPLAKTFSATVTKGVVSGYRDIDGIKLIQSDVSVMPGNSGGPLLDQSGNIVGLSRSMVGLAGFPIKTGISFFTPISDVFRVFDISSKN